MNFGYTARMANESPKAPDLSELFELSLLAPFSPAVFRTAAARPAPSFGTAMGLALSTGMAAAAIQLAKIAVADSNFLENAAPTTIASVAAIALFLYVVFFLMFAALLGGLGRALGGKASFERGLQAAAMLSVLGPVQMLCNGFPIAWALPSALAAWVAAGALAGLFEAKPWPARSLCAVLAAGAIGAQAVGRDLADRALMTYQTTQLISQSMRAFPAPVVLDTTAPLNESAPPLATSGLDLLRGPDDGGSTPQMPAAADMGIGRPPPNIPAGAVVMLDAISPMLNNPALTRKMSAPQKEDLKRLQLLIASMKENMASGKSTRDPAFAKNMADLQRLTMKMMAVGIQVAPQATSK